MPKGLGRKTVSQANFKHRLKRNDWVIYRKQKSSATPGPRASDVRPAGKGELYHYMVDKYWVVEKVLDSGEVQLCTRRGKRNIVAMDSPLLRLATWWERIIYRHRFKAIDLGEPVDESGADQLSKAKMETSDGVEPASGSSISA